MTNFNLPDDKLGNTLGTWTWKYRNSSVRRNRPSLNGLTSHRIGLKSKFFRVTGTGEP